MPREYREDLAICRLENDACHKTIKASAAETSSNFDMFIAGTIVGLIIGALTVFEIKK